MAKLQKFLQKRGQDVCLMYFSSHILTTFGAKSLFLCSTVILSYIFKMNNGFRPAGWLFFKTPPNMFLIFSL